jgi:hypothetical protein
VEFDLLVRRGVCWFWDVYGRDLALRWRGWRCSRFGVVVRTLGMVASR